VRRISDRLLEGHLHGTGDVHQQDGVPGKPRRAPFERAEHGGLQRLLPLRCVAPPRPESEGKNPVRLHTFERGQNQVLADPGLCRLRRFRSRASEPSLRSASRRSTPRACSRPPRLRHAGNRERNLPGVGRNQLVLSQPLPQGNLRFIHRPRVREEKHVAQTNSAGAIVLGQRVLVELANAAASPS